MNDKEKSFDDIEIQNDIGIVKINDAEEAEEYGLGDLPAVVLFQNKLPTVFTGNVEDEDEVLVRGKQRWLKR
jgi:hypothetical protein